MVVGLLVVGVWRCGVVWGWGDVRKGAVWCTWRGVRCLVCSVCVTVGCASCVRDVYVAHGVRCAMCDVWQLLLEMSWCCPGVPSWCRRGVGGDFGRAGGGSTQGHMLKGSIATMLCCAHIDRRAALRSSLAGVIITSDLSCPCRKRRIHESICLLGPRDEIRFLASFQLQAGEGREGVVLCEWLWEAASPRVHRHVCIGACFFVCCSMTMGGMRLGQCSEVI